MTGPAAAVCVGGSCGRLNNVPKVSHWMEVLLACSGQTSGRFLGTPEWTGLGFALAPKTNFLISLPQKSRLMVSPAGSHDPYPPIRLALLAHMILTHQSD
ncbi:hypothetical protein H1C71_018420 [Ictidomys tridecemlineatus]|nr:hypothetical protein H1C71_018420 [Ictidomys tridecemlineatus]